MTFVETWYKQIEGDLVPFIDPGTELALSVSGSVIEAIWSQRRKELFARFLVSNISEISVEFLGKVFSYRSFFASEHMADLLGIAKSTTLIHASKSYVETRAEAEAPDGSTRVGPATNLVANLVAAREIEEDRTNFIMVTGEAGAGKTSVLKELVTRQARDYAKGQASFVYLYVDAQGRALARFNEALATELNDLRVSLPIHAVPPMVRLGLIVPVVDGFDELIGAGGYDDSFTSISSFVESLNGKGAIVASARSTYYEQEFLARANRNAGFGAHAWRLTSVEVLAWGDEEIEEFVSLRTGGDSDAAESLKSKLRRVFSGENEPLGRKPLFVVRVGRLLEAGEDLSGEGRLLEQLLDAFLAREQHDKLLSKSGKPILSKEELRSLCADLAEEMWLLGTRELDKVTVRDLAEVAMSDASVSTADKTTVIERMPHMAFLMSGESTGSVVFEHELFFDLFLSGRVAAKLSVGNPGVGETLSRSSMPESLASGIAEQLPREGEGIGSMIVETLSKASGVSGPRQQVVKENSGRILAAYLLRSESPLENISVRNISFPGSKLAHARFCGIEFANVEFKRVDLVDTKFEGCTGTDVYFDAPMVSPGTRLEISGIAPADSFIGMNLVGDSESKGLTYDPAEIESILRRLGLPAAQREDHPPGRAVNPEAVRLVTRIAKAYSKCNPICEEDDYLGSIFDSPLWPEVKRAALESGVLKHEHRGAHGPRRNFYRIQANPDELAKGAIRGASVSRAVHDFWERLELAELD